MRKSKQGKVYIAWIIVLCFLGSILSTVTVTASEFYGSEEKQVLDLTVSSVKPGERTAGLTRDESTAAMVDALTGSFEFSVYDYCTPAGQDLRLEAWTDTSGIVRKITVIEKAVSGNPIVTDLYYTSYGKAAFAIERINSVPTPVTAASLVKGQQYFITRDVLVTLREVDSFGSIHDSVLDGVTTYNSSTAYSSLPSAQQAYYDSEEQRIINMFYSALAEVQASHPAGLGVLRGAARFYDGTPAAGAQVLIFSAEGDTFITSTMTDSSGKYAVYLPMETGFKVMIASNGYAQITIQDQQISSQTRVGVVETAVLVPGNTEKQNVVIHLADAMVNGSATGANSVITVRSSVSVRDTDVIATSSVDGNGNASFSLPVGMHSVTVTCPGYIPTTRTIVVDHEETFVIHLLRSFSGDDARIVVSWHGDVELDAHCFTGAATNNGESAVLDYANTYDADGHYFVIDALDASGCEVISLPDPASQAFRLYVSNVDGCRNPLASNLSRVTAQVDIYRSWGQEAHFSLPYAKDGQVWEVFELAGNTFTDLHEIYPSAAGQDAWMKEKNTNTVAFTVHDTYDLMLIDLKSLIESGIYRYPGASYTAATLVSSGLDTELRAFFEAMLAKGGDLINVVYGYQDINQDGYDELLLSGSGNLSTVDVIFERVNGVIRKVASSGNYEKLYPNNDMIRREWTAGGITATEFFRPKADGTKDVIAAVFTDESAKQSGKSFYWYGHPEENVRYPIDESVYWGYIIYYKADTAVSAYRLTTTQVAETKPQPTETHPQPTETQPQPTTEKPTEQPITEKPTEEESEKLVLPDVPTAPAKTVSNDVYYGFLNEVVYRIQMEYRYPGVSYTADTLNNAGLNAAEQAFFESMMYVTDDLYKVVIGFADVNSDGCDELLMSGIGDVSQPTLIYEYVDGQVRKIVSANMGENWHVNGNMLRSEWAMGSREGIDFFQPQSDGGKKIIISVCYDSNAESYGELPWSYRLEGDTESTMIDQIKYASIITKYIDSAYLQGYPLIAAE